MRETLWPANTFGRIGVLSGGVGLGGSIGLIALWFVTPPETVTMTVVDPLMSVFEGMAYVGLALVVNAWFSNLIERFKLLNPTVASDGQPTDDLWDNAPASPTGYEGLQLADAAPARLAYLQMTIPVVPLYWLTLVIDSAVTTVRPMPSLPEGWVTLGVVLGASVVVIALHELVHAAIATGFGYSVSFGHALPAAVYVKIEGAIVQRSEKLWITAAPLAILTPGLLLVALVSSGWLVPVAHLMAMLNVLVAAGDVYQLCTFLWFPPGSLLYHPPDDEPLGVFEPADAPESILQRLDHRAAAVIGPLSSPSPGR